MTQVKLVGIALVIVALLGILGVGVVDDLVFGGPERRQTAEPSALEARLSPGEWIALAGQEILAVQRAGVLWEGQMGAVGLGDGSEASGVIEGLRLRALDARSELAAVPLGVDEREERARTDAALGEVVAGTAAQIDRLEADDLTGVLAQAPRIRVALGELRGGPFPQEQ